MIILYGKPVAKKILEEVKAGVAKLERPPLLKVACEDFNQPYYKGIIKDAKYCGIEIAKSYRSVYRVDGVISLIPSYKPAPSVDMDGGMTKPCTAEAIMELLLFYNIPVTGKNVCVIGYSERVGKPLTSMLLDARATVTTCHSKTKDLHWHLTGKDIIISCVGKAEIDLRGIVTQYTTLVNVGDDFINVDDCAALAPFIGGVGPVTRAVLMRHVYEKARKGKIV